MAGKHDRHGESKEETADKELEVPASQSPAKRRRRRRAKAEGGKKSSKNTRPTGRPTRRKIPDDPKDTEYPEKVQGIPKKISKLVDNRFFADLIREMEVNKALTIIYKGDNTWKLMIGGPGAVSKMLQLKGKAYRDEVLSEEFQEHEEEWDELTEAQKIQIAKDAGAEWDEHSISRVNLMRCADAYRKTIGIEKYKPEYSTISARKAIRG